MVWIGDIYSFHEKEERHTSTVQRVQPDSTDGQLERKVFGKTGSRYVLLHRYNQSYDRPWWGLYRERKRKINQNTP